ncbi:protein PHYTOCHROME KINASE SUBSTRATE 4-like [Primulina tabacum]|uniref:protein PHYTOCHROME KINASE SUBSTRATE 4-like n=1 Tax=Primulina tabacum TaxID=48773 RepID=UPI003F59BFBB
MESQNLVKSFKYNSPQQPIFSVIESPLRYRSLPQTNPTPFKEIFFPSYIQPKDPKKVSQGNETGCNIDDSEISIFDAQKYFSENNEAEDIKKPPQQQITAHNMLSVPRLSSVSSADGYGRNYRTRSFHTTPTASSEASWNSQTGLLANPPGSMAVSLRNLPSDMRSKKRNPAAKKWSFCRKCCCSGKNSVKVKEATSDSDIRGPAVIHIDMGNLEKTSHSYAKRGQSRDEKAPENMPQKISVPNVEMAFQQKATAPNYPLQLSPEKKFSPTDPPRQQRVSPSGRPFGDANAAAFTFPILNSSIQTTKPAGFKAMITKSVINPLEDPPRDSLEVFQPVHDPMSISRTPDFNPGSPMARLSNMDDDMYSDASSDLFEIESFSTQSNSYQMYRGRDSLEDEAPAFRFASARCMISSNNNNLHGRRSMDEPPTPSVAGTECYTPSEVSIDWSVTTAEGFDRASVTNFSISASEIGKVAFLHKRLQEEASGGDGGKRKGNGLLLMSCRQEKSVSVGPQPVKCSVPEGPPLFPLGISGGAGHVGGRPPRANKLPLGSSHSARLSLAFAA